MGKYDDKEKKKLLFGAVRTGKLNYIFFVFLILALIGLHVVMINKFCDAEISSLQAGIQSVKVICITIFSLWLIGDYLSDLITVDMRKLLVLTLLLTGSYIVMMFLESQGYAYIVDTQYIGIGNIYMSKKYIYDAVVLFFAASMVLIRKSLEEDFSMWNKVSAIAIILINTLMGLSLYAAGRSFSGIYTIELAFLFAVSTAWLLKAIMDDHSEKDDRKLGNYIGIFLIYIFVLVGIVTMIVNISGETLSEYMYQGWNEKKAGIYALIDKSAVFGHRVELNYDEAVHTLLSGSHNPIHFLMFYGGKVAAEIYILCLAVFMRICWKFLGTRYAKLKPLQPIYNIAFVTLLLRAVVGTLYSLGVVPLALNPLFSGDVSIIFDLVMVVLLVFSERQNQKARFIAAFCKGLELFAEQYSLSYVSKFAGRYINTKDFKERYISMYHWLLTDSMESKSLEDKEENVYATYLGDYADGNDNYYEMFISLDAVMPEILLVKRIKRMEGENSGVTAGYEVVGDEEIIKQAIHHITNSLLHAMKYASIWDSEDFLLYKAS